MSDKTTTPEPLVSDERIASRVEEYILQYRTEITRVAKEYRDEYEVDRRSHLSRIQELEDQVKALREAGGEAMDLISSAQSVLERYLQPDGHTKERCMDLLIGLFDGPRQRKVESAWDAASKPSNNNTGS